MKSFNIQIILVVDRVSNPEATIHKTCDNTEEISHQDMSSILGKIATE